MSAVRDDWVVVGRVLAVFGIQGWIKVFSYTRTPLDIGHYREWWLSGTSDWQRYGVRAVREQGHGIVAQLEGVSERDAAAQLVGRDIAIRREALPALARGEYYWSQLEGLRVINALGIELGRVDHLLETGANDVMVVAGERERLIPYVAHVVQAVDLAQGVIKVDWDADF